MHNRVAQYQKKDVMRYHFTGVGGVGMSAVAQAALAVGNAVTGSDCRCDGISDLRSQISDLEKLRIAGVSLVPQDSSGITQDLDAVVVSTAIEEDNPDLIAAQKLGLSVLHRSEMLAGLLEGKRCIAVTGTSGKSTVAGMIGWTLSGLGADPTVVNGAPVLGWVDDGHIGNFRAGGSDLWVIEADESDRSLLNYHPEMAVITNVSADHFDIEETNALFDAFRKKVSGDTIEGPVDVEPGVESAMRGRHNLENAAVAAALCERLGYARDDVRRVLESFKGIHRRFETVGQAGGITVIDDYAHNPAKIQAAWETARDCGQRVIGVWRPHGYGPLRKMMEDLASLFNELCSGDDRLLVLPVYDAGGTADRSVNSDALVEKVSNAEYAGPENVADAVGGIAGEGDVVLVMGARDPGLPQLARQIYYSL